MPEKKRVRKIKSLLFSWSYKVGEDKEHSIVVDGHCDHHQEEEHVGNLGKVGRLTNKRYSLQTNRRLILPRCILNVEVCNSPDFDRVHRANFVQATCFLVTKSTVLNPDYNDNTT